MRSQAAELERVDRTARANLAWADRFVASLARAGVRDAVLCPGSRSAPLALAFERSPLTTHIALDERSGAYFALGLAKGARRPAAVLCTSGTAAANFFPAVLEARYGRVPLLVLTADRPPELRGIGAPQTIDQVKLYSENVRWFAEAGVPEEDRPGLEYVASLAERAVAEAWKAPGGPVHLNFPFREPLVPEPDAVPPFAEVADSEALVPDPPAPFPEAIRRLARSVRGRRRGILACGPDDPSPGFAAAIERLSSITGYPILADPLSPARYRGAAGARALGAYDSFLRSPSFAARGAELVLHFGAPPTSKALAAFSSRGASHVVVDAGGERRGVGRRSWPLLQADATLAAEALAEALASSCDPLPSWAESFRRAERVAREVLERRVAEAEDAEEAAVLPDLMRVLPDGAVLYVGNSMPVRDLDAFVPACDRPVRVLANRGLNGIDGVVSSALGASAAAGSPLLLVTGDLSFHHDLNALHLVRGGAAAATIVVIHNDGGGIFSFLPVARHPEFERCFATPHGLGFAPIAALYGIPHHSIESREELRERAEWSLAQRTTVLLEVRTSRSRNRAFHQSVWDEVIQAVDRESTTNGGAE